jgi:hypothetical protein
MKTIFDYFKRKRERKLRERLVRHFIHYVGNVDDVEAIFQYIMTGPATTLNRTWSEAYASGALDVNADLGLHPIGTLIKQNTLTE